MAYTQADLQRIQDAKSGGARAITFSDGRHIEHFTVAELSQIESDIKNELAAQSSRPTVRRIKITTTKDF